MNPQLILVAKDHTHLKQQYQMSLLLIHLLSLEMVFVTSKAVSQTGSKIMIDDVEVKTKDIDVKKLYSAIKKTVAQ